jgi:hypothetical protein
VAKQSGRASGGTQKYEYIVWHVKSPTEATRLGLTKGKNADDAIGQFADYDPKTLAAVPKARWTQREGVCLENEPKLNLGKPVEVSDEQMELEAA